MLRFHHIAMSGALLLILGACARDGDAGSGPTADAVVASATPGATPTATATPAPRNVINVNAGAWLVDWGERVAWDNGSPGESNGAIVALDPETGDEIAGWEPVPAGQAYTPAVSPDGSMVALSWALTQSGPWRLAILDASTGEPISEFEEPGAVFEVHWSTDGANLYAIEGDVFSAGMVRGSRLWEFRWQEPAAARPLGDLPYHVAALRLGLDRRFYVLGYESKECCGIDIEGDPFVAVLDQGEEFARIPLPGLVLGQRFEQRGAPGSQANVLRSPGVAIAPDASRLYIAHSDGDAITVVNLQAMAVDAVVTPGQPKSALARFGSWLGGLFVTEASAKGGAYYTKEAVVSADGRFLYLTGYQPEFCETDEFFPCVERRPIGLTVVDLGSMEVAAHHPGIARITFTPGWDRIIGTGETIDYRGGDDAEVIRHGPFVIDAATHELLAEPAAGLAEWLLVPSNDGRHAFAVVTGPGMEAAASGQGACATECYTLRVIDLESGALVSERHYAAYLTFINLVPQP